MIAVAWAPLLHARTFAALEEVLAGALPNCSLLTVAPLSFGGVGVGFGIGDEDLNISTKNAGVHIKFAV